MYLRADADGMVSQTDIPVEEAFGAVELVGEGLIGQLGLSGASVEQLERAQRVAPVVAVQNRYNLADRGDAAMLERCREQNIAFVPLARPTTPRRRRLRWRGCWRWHRRWCSSPGHRASN